MTPLLKQHSVILALVLLISVIGILAITARANRDRQFSTVGNVVMALEHFIALKGQLPVHLEEALGGTAKLPLDPTTGQQLRLVSDPQDVTESCLLILPCSFNTYHNNGTVTKRPNAGFYALYFYPEAHGPVMCWQGEGKSWTLHTVVLATRACVIMDSVGLDPSVAGFDGSGGEPDLEEAMRLRNLSWGSNSDVGRRD
jgi:hypothetical protein